MQRARIFRSDPFTEDGPAARRAVALMGIKRVDRPPSEGRLIAQWIGSNQLALSENKSGGSACGRSQKKREEDVCRLESKVHAANLPLDQFATSEPQLLPNPMYFD